MATGPAFLLALAVSLAATPLVRLAALRRGFVARPTGDRWHRRPTALLGGVAVFLATVPAAVVGGWPPAPFLAIGAGAVLVFFVGLADDLLKLRPTAKLAWQIAAASLAVWGGASLGWTESLTLDTLLTIFWLIGVTNAFNLIDNMDGACAGVGTIAAASVGAIALLAPGGPAPGAAWAVALAGALAGFLAYNFHPAKIFLGDSGSLFIGFLLAGLTSAVAAGATSSRLSLIAAPVLVLAVPIFDTTLVTLARRLSGRRASVGGTDHTAHRLVRLGFSEVRAVLVLYLLTSLAGAAAVALLSHSPAWELLAGVLVLTLGLLGLVLMSVRVYGGEDYSVVLGGPARQQLAGFLLRRHVFEVLLDLGLVAAAYYVSHRLRFEAARWPMFFPTFLRSLPIVIACHVLALLVTGAYGRIWRYFGLTDLVSLAKGVALGSASSILLLVYLYRFQNLSRGVLLINAVLLFTLLSLSRTVFRVLPGISGRDDASLRHAVGYGAGDAGEMLVRELENNRRYGYRLMAFVDDDVKKAGRRVRGIPVVGPASSLADVIGRFGAEAVIVSSDLIRPDRLAAAASTCREAGVHLLQFRLTLEGPLTPQPASPAVGAATAGHPPDGIVAG